jgi:RNA polymerase sigma-70 factor, ECF subfamily
MPADEAQLVSDLKAGRREAFDRMVELHYDRLHRLASTMTGSSEDAADLVQETFLAAMKSAANFRGEARLTTWLIAILRNQYTLYLRGRRKWRFASLDAAGGARAHGPAPAVRPEVVAILERVRRLPEELRTALVLFYLEGMRYQEIADAMECPVGTIRSRLFEARERLKKMMEGAAP